MFTFPYLCTKVKISVFGLLKKLISKAGLTNEEYIAIFYKKL
jgi:hypothetical protein